MTTKKKKTNSRPATKSAKKTVKIPAEQSPRDPRIPAVGTVLKRQFKGRDIEVVVSESGFEFEDQTFKSISSVARHITGYGISGPAFFRLDKEPKK